MKRTKMPRDVNQRAKLLVELSTGQADPEPESPPKDPAAVARGRLGGAKLGWRLPVGIVMLAVWVAIVGYGVATQQEVSGMLLVTLGMSGVLLVLLIGQGWAMRTGR